MRHPCCLLPPLDPYPSRSGGFCFAKDLIAASHNEDRRSNQGGETGLNLSIPQAASTWSPRSSETSYFVSAYFARWRMMLKASRSVSVLETAKSESEAARTISKFSGSN